MKIDEKELNYRLNNLIFSQNMLNTWKRNKEEFYKKYILGLFWSEDKEEDRIFDERMLYGREFHLMCQRIFLGIPAHYDDIDVTTRDNLKKIENIKNIYIEKYGDNVKFYPEYSIEFGVEIDDKISIVQAMIDLVVLIFDNDRLKYIQIWDWKTEFKEISVSVAENKMQTLVYLYLCKSTLGENIDFEKISMHYFQPGINNNVKVRYSEEKHLKYEDVIKETISEILSTCK